MTIEEKKQAILKAVDEKKVSARAIDKSGKGTNITRLRKGKVRNETIESLYSSLLAILETNKKRRKKQRKSRKKSKRK